MGKQTVIRQVNKRMHLVVENDQQKNNAGIGVGRVWGYRHLSHRLDNEAVLQIHPPRDSERRGRAMLGLLYKQVL